MVLRGLLGENFALVTESQAQRIADANAGIGTSVVQLGQRTNEVAVPAIEGLSSSIQVLTDNLGVFLTIGAAVGGLLLFRGLGAANISGRLSRRLSDSFGRDAISRVVTRDAVTGARNIALLTGATTVAGAAVVGLTTDINGWAVALGALQLFTVASSVTALSGVFLRNRQFAQAAAFATASFGRSMIAAAGSSGVLALAQRGLGASIVALGIGTTGGIISVALGGLAALGAAAFLYGGAIDTASRETRASISSFETLGTELGQVTEAQNALTAASGLYSGDATRATITASIARRQALAGERDDAIRAARATIANAQASIASRNALVPDLGDSFLGRIGSALLGTSAAIPGASLANIGGQPSGRSPHCGSPTGSGGTGRPTTANRRGIEQVIDSARRHPRGWVQPNRRRQHRG